MGTSQSSSLQQTLPTQPLEAEHIPVQSIHNPKPTPQTYVELSYRAFQDKLPQRFFDGDLRNLRLDMSIVSTVCHLKEENSSLIIAFTYVFLNIFFLTCISIVV